MRYSRVFQNRVDAVSARAFRPLIAAGIVSLGAYGLLQTLSSERPLTYTDEMLHAAEIMEQATAAAREYCDSVGIEIDAALDPNGTCLIGPELTGLMTTLGHLDAKRTTTDPAMASLIAFMLDQVGVSRGDTIAIGSSASFPALLIASLAAAEAMGVHPVTIISLGSSTYGATNPSFNLLSLHLLLVRKGVFRFAPAGISLGGKQDVGGGFDAPLRDALIRQIGAARIPFIVEPDLRDNVARRMAIYEGHPSRRRVSAFINAGGSYANMGTSNLALRLDPGINTEVSLPPAEERGVLFDMAARNVPVIHLLFIRGLALKYGIMWDPVPLSRPGTMALHADGSRNRDVPWMIGVPYLALVLVLVAMAPISKAARSQQGRIMDG